MISGRYYIKEDDQFPPSEDELSRSYHLFDRWQQNELGEDFCVLAFGTYEQCLSEMEWLIQENRFKLVIDETFHWEGFGDGFGKWDSHCRLRIFKNDAAVVVVASDQGEDTGTSITNCASQLASLVAQQYELDPQRLTWIEHYPGTNVEFSQVWFDWAGNKASNVQWKYLPPQQAAAIVGVTQLD